MLPYTGQMKYPLGSQEGRTLVPTAMTLLVASRVTWVESTVRSCSTPLR